jgi:hypothetical protein
LGVTLGPNETENNLNDSRLAGLFPGAGGKAAAIGRERTGRRIREILKREASWTFMLKTVILKKH